MLAKSMTAAQTGSTTWARPNLPADVARLNAAITPRIAQTSRTTESGTAGIGPVRGLRQFPLVLAARLSSSPPCIPGSFSGDFGSDVPNQIQDLLGCAIGLAHNGIDDDIVLHAESTVAGYA